MTASAPSQSLFDVFIENITASPRNLAVFLLTIAGLYVSLPMLLIGILGALILRILKLPEWWFIIAGALLAILVWVVVGETPKSVFLQNKLIFRAFIQGSLFYLAMPLIWLCALPYGCLLAACYGFTERLHTKLHLELKRVGQGKHEQKKPLTEKQWQVKLAKIDKAACVDGTNLGVNLYSGETASLKDKDANLHTLAIGSTGAGKTSGICNIIESAISRGFCVPYIGGKGDLELAARIKTYADHMGVPFYFVGMINGCGLISMAYNPIADGGYTLKKDRIIELRTWSEDHYRKIAEGYLQTVFQILERADVPLDLFQLARYLEPDALFELVRKMGDKTLANTLASLEEKCKDISSLIAEIENMANSEISHIFDCQNKPSLTLSQALKERAVVYFCLRPLLKETSSASFSFKTSSQLLITTCS